jgi:hypothetical protein
MVFSFLENGNTLFKSTTKIGFSIQKVFSTTNKYHMANDFSDDESYERSTLDDVNDDFENGIREPDRIVTQRLIEPKVSPTDLYDDEEIQKIIDSIELQSVSLLPIDDDDVDVLLIKKDVMEDQILPMLYNFNLKNEVYKTVYSSILEKLGHQKLISSEIEATKPDAKAEEVKTEKDDTIPIDIMSDIMSESQRVSMQQEK